jgi:hypothetical protein
MVRSQKELINNSVQNITEAYTRILKVQDELKDAGLCHFLPTINRIAGELAIQAKDLNDLNK